MIFTELSNQALLPTDKKIAAIHQPNYFPWLGYFAKIQNCDVFIVLDNVDYQSGNAKSITNRTRIKTQTGELFLTVPVLKPDGNQRLINQTRIDGKQNWQKKHLTSVQHAYSKAPFFNEVFEMLSRILNAEFEFISDLNSSGIRAVMNYLSLETPVIFSSSFENLAEGKNERIIDLCKRTNSCIYLSGGGAKKYNDPQMFADHQIELRYAEFKPKEYPQLHGAFIPGLSILDALFNCGRDARLLLNGAK